MWTWKEYSCRPTIWLELRCNTAFIWLMSDEQCLRDVGKQCGTLNWIYTLRTLNWIAKRYAPWYTGAWDQALKWDEGWAWEMEFTSHQSQETCLSRPLSPVKLVTFVSRNCRHRGARPWFEMRGEVWLRCFMSGNHQFTSDWGHDLAHFRELGV